ncbi:signal peptidase I, partial [Streptomyces albogriseolus]
HRGSSSDSRDRLGSPGGGMVPVEKVVGRAEGLVWPFGRAGRLEPTDAYDKVPAGEASAPAAAPTGGGHG